MILSLAGGKRKTAAFVLLWMQLFSSQVAAMAMVQLQIPFDPATGLALAPAAVTEEVIPVVAPRVPAGAGNSTTAVSPTRGEVDILADEDD